MNSGSEDELEDSNMNQDGQSTIKFKLTITNNVWSGINSLIETDGKFEGKFKLKSEYVKHIAPEISAHENLPISLRDRKSRVYPIKKKKTTNFLVAYTCCTKCNVRYIFTIPDKPSDSDLSVELCVKKTGTHDHSGNKQKKQVEHKPKVIKAKTNIKGDNIKRSSIIANGSFTSIDGHNTTIINEKEKFESVETYKKLFECYESKDRSDSQDLFSNLIYVANTQRTCIASNNVQGFIRDLKIFDEFSFIMHSEHQLKSIEYINPEYRILNLTLTGNLIKINSSKFKNQKLLNYFAILKDSRTIGMRNVKSLLVSEMISSKFNVNQLYDFYLCIRRSYNDIFPLKKLSFKYIVTDFLWENIHSCLDVFNNETINEYSDRVYKLSKGEIDSYLTNNQHKSWVTTCASHTLTKFIKILKRNIKDNKLRTISCFVFSLLMNSIDLNSISIYFKFICHAFLNPLRTELNYNSLKEIQNLISRRSKDEAEILKCINSLEITEKNSTDLKNNVIYCQIDDYSIKLNSPFTKVFHDIEIQVRDEIATEVSTSLVTNTYYSQDLIRLLQDHFMPYAFLWASFCLRQNENQITRLTNLTSDQFINNRKNIIKTDLEPLSPVEYGIVAFSVTKQKTDLFIKYQQTELDRRLENFKLNENESYYLSSIDDYLEQNDVINESININLNDIEFDFF